MRARSPNKAPALDGGIPGLFHSEYHWLEASDVHRQNRIAGRWGREHIRTMTRTLTAVLMREGDGFVALCPEIDVASEGDSVEAAKANLREAVELFFECASEEEVQGRLSSESYVSALEVSVA